MPTSSVWRQTCFMDIDSPKSSFTRGTLRDITNTGNIKLATKDSSARLQESVFTSRYRDPNINTSFPLSDISNLSKNNPSSPLLFSNFNVARSRKQFDGKLASLKIALESRSTNLYHPSNTKRECTMNAPHDSPVDLERSDWCEGSAFSQCPLPDSDPKKPNYSPTQRTGVYTSLDRRFNDSPEEEKNEYKLSRIKRNSPVLSPDGLKEATTTEPSIDRLFTERSPLTHGSLAHQPPLSTIMKEEDSFIAPSRGNNKVTFQHREYRTPPPLSVGGLSVPVNENMSIKNTITTLTSGVSVKGDTSVDPLLTSKDYSRRDNISPSVSPAPVDPSHGTRSLSPGLNSDIESPSQRRGCRAKSLQHMSRKSYSGRSISSALRSGCGVLKCKEVLSANEKPRWDSSSKMRSSSLTHRGDSNGFFPSPPKITKKLGTIPSSCVRREHKKIIQQQEITGNKSVSSVIHQCNNHKISSQDLDSSSDSMYDDNSCIEEHRTCSSISQPLGGRHHHHCLSASSARKFEKLKASMLPANLHQHTISYTNSYYSSDEDLNGNSIETFQERNHKKCCYSQPRGSHVPRDTNRMFTKRVTGGNNGFPRQLSDDDSMYERSSIDHHNSRDEHYAGQDFKYIARAMRCSSKNQVRHRNSEVSKSRAYTPNNVDLHNCTHLNVNGENSNKKIIKKKPQWSSFVGKRWCSNGANVDSGLVNPAILKKRVIYMSSSTVSNNQKANPVRKRKEDNQRNLSPSPTESTLSYIKEQKEEHRSDVNYSPNYRSPLAKNNIPVIIKDKGTTQWPDSHRETLSNRTTHSPRISDDRVSVRRRVMVLERQKEEEKALEELLEREKQEKLHQFRMKREQQSTSPNKYPYIISRDSSASSPSPGEHFDIPPISEDTCSNQRSSLRQSTETSGPSQQRDSVGSNTGLSAGTLSAPPEKRSTSSPRIKPPLSDVTLAVHNDSFTYATSVPSPKPATKVAAKALISRLPKAHNGQGNTTNCPSPVPSGASRKSNIKWRDSHTRSSDGDKNTKNENRSNHLLKSALNADKMAAMYVAARKTSPLCEPTESCDKVRINSTTISQDHHILPSSEDVFSQRVEDQWASPYDGYKALHRNDGRVYKVNTRDSSCSPIVALRRSPDNHKGPNMVWLSPAAHDSVSERRLSDSSLDSPTGKRRPESADCVYDFSISCDLPAQSSLDVNSHPPPLNDPSAKPLMHCDEAPLSESIEYETTNNARCEAAVRRSLQLRQSIYGSSHYPRNALSQYSSSTQPSPSGFCSSANFFASNESRLVRSIDVPLTNTCSPTPSLSSRSITQNTSAEVVGGPLVASLRVVPSTDSGINSILLHRGPLSESQSRSSSASSSNLCCSATQKIDDANIRDGSINSLTQSPSRGVGKERSRRSSMVTIINTPIIMKSSSPDDRRGEVDHIHPMKLIFPTGSPKTVTEVNDAVPSSPVVSRSFQGHFSGRTSGASSLRYLFDMPPRQALPSPLTPQTVATVPPIAYTYKVKDPLDCGINSTPSTTDLILKMEKIRNMIRESERSNGEC